MMYCVDEIQNIINKKFNSLLFEGKPAELYAPISYTLNIGGKRIRPALLLMACDLFGGDIEIASDTAIGLEFFHNFTLIHDDIMDNAPLRRGKETVYKKWNSNIAILSGDTMFALAYKQVIKTQTPYLQKILDVFTKTAIEVCEGQQMDLNFEMLNEVSIQDYLEMIRLKTAVLIGASLKIGSLIAGAAQTDAENIFKFGENIGIAFQLKDDFLDAFGDENKFGKKTGGDIVANKKTYLYIKAYEIADENTRMVLKNYFSENTINMKQDKKINSVKDIFLKMNVNKHIEKDINIFYKKAIDCIREVALPDTRKETLVKFSKTLMHRDI
jgi:geranylgeranyl diphosphate synthase, type II